MKKIVIVGGGGHCKSVLDSLLELNEYQEITVTDMDKKPGDKIMGVTVAGDDSKLKALFENGYDYAFLAFASIDSPKLRRKLYNTIKEIGFKIPNIIDKTAVVSRFSKLGEGVFVGKNAVINAEAQIGDMTIVNTKALIEHECIVGSFSHISVGAVLCGQAVVGNDAFVGANATVIQGIRVGNSSIIGAGSVITRDVDENCKVINKKYE